MNLAYSNARRDRADERRQSDEGPPPVGDATIAERAAVLRPDHFTAIRPVSEAIARAILADTGASPRIALDATAIAAAVAR